MNSAWSGKRSSVYVRGKGWRTAPKPTPKRPLAPRPKLAEEPSVSYLASFDCGSFAIPHPQKQEKGGEDAHFYHGKQGWLAMGVCDGVSGWASEGVDPATYARELSEHGELAARNPAIFGEEPWSILDYAHSRAESLGSSTFTITNLISEEEGKSGGSGKKAVARLKWANVGDSGVKVFRYGSVVSASAVQEHYFNCPRQLGNPKKVRECDTPDAAEEDEVALRRGDVVVLATDGVFDNVFDKEISELVNKHKKRSAGEIAEAIARRASTNSRNRKYESPFAKEAYALEKKEGGGGAVLTLGGGGLSLNGIFSDLGLVKEENPYIGGKLDDITCVVAVVK